MGRLLGAYNPPIDSTNRDFDIRDPSVTMCHVKKIEGMPRVVDYHVYSHGGH